MRSTRMVPLITVRGTFHARVIAARLGAEGILTELRGNVDGPYPMGDVHVLVEEDAFETARELLLADEVEDALSGSDDVDMRTPPELWVMLAAIVLIALISLGRAL